jgi:hypothetical protein
MNAELATQVCSLTLSRFRTEAKRDKEAPVIITPSSFLVFLCAYSMVGQLIAWFIDRWGI